MFNLCVLVSTYHPFHSANSKCIGNIVEALADSYSVTVIASGLMGMHDSYVNNVKVIANPHARAPTFFSRGLSFIRRLSHKNSADVRVSSFFLDSLLKLKDVPDIIIPVCFPIESLHAALSYKSMRDVAVIPYLLDVISSSDTAHTFQIMKNIKLRSNLNFERSLVMRSNCVVVNEPWYEHLKKINALNDNVYLLGHPLVKDFRNKNSVTNFRGVKFYYGGVLSKKIRDPSFFIEVFRVLLQKRPDFHLDICHRGDCADLVSSLSGEFSSATDYGFVGSDEAITLMLQANFLVLIGNNHSGQIQSKVYEYISCGAPIVFFCKQKDDPVIDILSSYPNALTIVDGEGIDSVVSKIEAFASGQKISLISYEEISSIYKENCVEHIADRFAVIVRSAMMEAPLNKAGELY